MSEYLYTPRKQLLARGADPSVGNPSFHAGLVTALAGVAWTLGSTGTDVRVVTAVALNQAQQDAAQAAYDAWVPWNPAVHMTARIAALGVDAEDFIHSHYDTGQTSSLLMFHNMAVVDGWTNRRDHIRTAFDWADAVIDEYLAKGAAVQTATTPEEVEAVVFDWTTWVAANPDPGVTIPSVKVITT